jgi:hypothetical protein
MASDRKSRLQRWLGTCGKAIGVRVPSARFASAPATHLKPFLAIEAAELFVVHDNTLAREQDMQPSIAEPPANGRQLAQIAPALPHRPADGFDTAPRYDRCQAPHTPAAR